MPLHLQGLVLVLLLGACSDPRPKGDTHRLRVGTWNLEHFGSRTPAREAEDFVRIAALIRSLEIDVLALQEINGPAPLHRLLDQLGDDYNFALGSTGQLDAGRISVGFLWNRRRARLVHCEEMRDLPDRFEGLPIFHRKPVNAVFQALDGTTATLDFRAITVHLKAGSEPDDRAKREAEAGILRQYLEDLRGVEHEDRDILVLGDFNHPHGAPAHEVFGRGEFIHYLTSDVGPTILHYDSPIDHIAVTSELSEAVIVDSFRIHNDAVPYGTLPERLLAESKDRWRRNYSDHFPVTLDLSTKRDRDPNGSFRSPTNRLRPGRHDD